MRRPSPLAMFAVSTFIWILVLTAVWTLVAKWTSHPAAVLSQVALEAGAPDWVRKAKVAPGTMEVDTRIEVFVPNSGGKRADIVVDAVPSRYAYGLPILLALLFAARGPKRLVRALGGYALLLPAQAFSLTFYLLMQMVLGAQGDRVALKVASWQLDAIAYGFQLGVLVVPTLTPVLLWLWLDRQFVSDILRKQSQHTAATARA